MVKKSRWPCNAMGESSTVTVIIDFAKTQTRVYNLMKVPPAFCSSIDRFSWSNGETFSNMYPMKHGRNCRNFLGSWIGWIGWLCYVLARALVTMPGCPKCRGSFHGCLACNPRRCSLLSRCLRKRCDVKACLTAFKH